MTNDTPRVAVVGAGRWGRNIVRALHEAGALAAVVDPRHDVQEEMRHTYPGIVAVGEPERAFESSSIDAVAIATPAVTHADLAIRAVQAGKDIFVEKPFSMTVQDAERVVKEADTNDRICMVGHLLMYQPAIAFLKEYLPSGEIGWVASLYQQRLNLGTVRTAENALWSLGVHDVAVMLHLVGEDPLEIAAWGQRIIQPQIEDDMHLHMLFEAGTEAHIHSSWLWPEKCRKLTVIGTEGMVVYDEDSQEVVLHRRRVLPDLMVSTGEPELLFRGDPNPLKFEIEHFLARVRDRNEPLSSGQSAVSVIDVLENANRQVAALAAETPGGRVYDLPFKTA